MPVAQDARVAVLPATYLVQPTNTPAFQLRRVAVRMHWSTITAQPKSCEPGLTAVTLTGGCLGKRNSAKQALKCGRRINYLLLSAASFLCPTMLRSGGGVGGTAAHPDYRLPAG